MREIKFRAWYKNAMHAVFDMHLHVNGSYRIEMFDGATSATCTLMQYTGLKDINGMDIYESDIVSIAHTSMLIPDGTIGVVTYANGRYIVETHTHTHGLNLFVDRRYRRYAKPYIEVVGNVWETPHLAPKK